MYENTVDENITKEGRFLDSKDGMEDVLRFHDAIDEIKTYNFNKQNHDTCEIAKEKIKKVQKSN